MTQEEGIETKYHLISDLISSFLTARGYRRRAGVFWLDRGVLLTLIELQKSQRSNVNCVYFTVDLSIVVKDLLDPMIDDLKKMRGHEGHLYWRAGDFFTPREDFWWKVSSQSDPVLIAEEICTFLSVQVFPSFEKLDSVAAVIEALRSGHHPPMSEKVRARLISELSGL